MALGEPDKSGRRRPVPQEGSEFTLTASTIISAIGQAVDGFCIGDKTLIDKWGNVVVNPQTLQTALPWVFSGGDCVTGPDIAIAAIGAGKRAAESIDEFVQHRLLSPAKMILTPAPKATGKICRRKHSRVSNRRIVWKCRFWHPQARKTNFDESSTTWDQETAMAEASRCLACGCTERYDCELRNYASDYGVAV